MRVLDLFSGIGGFSLGLERAGMETVAFCEIEPFPRKVLAKHWPDIPIYEDVRNVTKERLDADGIFPDVITGGFPCQDISVAGKQAGIGEGTRSGLWSECARILGEFRPRYAIFENVTALLSGNSGKWFERVLWDISQVGYDAEWHCIPASTGVGANHKRDRVWIIAYPCDNGAWQFRDWSSVFDKERHRQAQEYRRHKLEHGPWSHACNDANPNNERLQGRESPALSGRHIADGYSRTCGWWSTEPQVCRVDDGIPGSMDRLKGLGNAVVPQIPEIIGRAIMEAENDS